MNAFAASRSRFSWCSGYIGYMDLVATLGGITLNQTGREMESMMLVMLIYLSLSLAISTFMNWYNNRIRLVER